jgi:hypothetical protein
LAGVPLQAEECVHAMTGLGAKLEVKMRQRSEVSGWEASPFREKRRCFMP